MTNSENYRGFDIRAESVWAGWVAAFVHRGVEYKTKHAQHKFQAIDEAKRMIDEILENE